MAPKLYLLNIVTLEFRISTYEFGGYTDIQVKTHLIFFFFFLLVVAHINKKCYRALF